MRNLFGRSNRMLSALVAVFGSVAVGSPFFEAGHAAEQPATPYQLSVPSSMETIEAKRNVPGTSFYQTAPTQRQYTSEVELPAAPAAEPTPTNQATVSAGYPYANGGTTLYGASNFCTPTGLLPTESKRLGKFYFDGWISAGGTSNNQWPFTYAPVGGGHPVATDDAKDDFSVNQFYIVLGREAVKGCRWDYGVRADLLYGTDYLPVSSLGLESRNYRDNAWKSPASTVYQAVPRWNRNDRGGYPDYGLAMPQLYGEIYVPILSGLTVKGGHFYSPLGYESFPSPSNFFYTHSYTMLYAEAQTVTGVLADQKLNNHFSLLGGFSQGWDVWKDNNDALDVMIGARWESCDKNTSLAFMLMSGDAIVDHLIDYPAGDIPQNAQSVSRPQTNYSLVFQHKFSPVFTWVLQHDLGVAEDAAYELYDLDVSSTSDGKWYSVSNYLYWQMTPTLCWGFRAEWFKDEGYSRVWGGPTSSIFDFGGGRFGYKCEGDNFVDLSLGLNWKPNDWITIRPEVRWDYSDMKMVGMGGYPGTPGVYDHLTKDNLFTFGGDVLVRF